MERNIKIKTKEEPVLERVADKQIRRHISNKYEHERVDKEEKIGQVFICKHYECVRKKMRLDFEILNQLILFNFFAKVLV